MTLRVEIFPADLDATADFYAGVLGFRLVRDERRDLHAVSAATRPRHDVRCRARSG